MLRVKGWADFQHYKDRRPPWIKLHRELLENRKWHKLSYASRSLAICIWLLASEHEDPMSGLVDDDPEELAFRARMPEKEIVQSIKELIKQGFVEQIKTDASDLLSVCYQDASPEAEAEAEGKTKTEVKRKKSLQPEDVTNDTWDDWTTHRKAKKAPVTKTVIKRIRTECEKINWSLDEAMQYMCMRGWTGFNADWVNKEEKEKQNGLTKSQRADDAVERALQEVAAESSTEANSLPGTSELRYIQ